MAMNFSDEEKQKIMDEDLELYRKRDENTNAEDVKKLKGASKFSYYKQYYLGSAVVVVILVALLISLIHNSVKRNPSVVLYVAVYGDAIDDDAVLDFQEKVTEALGLDKEREQVVIDANVTRDQLQTYLYSGDADVVIAAEDTFGEWSRGGYFYEPEANQEVAFFNDYSQKDKFYSTYVTGEDVRDSAVVSEAVASDDTEYNFGLYIPEDSPYMEGLKGFVEHPVLGVSASTGNIDYVQEFVEYVMEED